MNLEELLRMKVKSINGVTGEEVESSPDFRVSIQHINEEAVEIIIHAQDHNSETLDFIVRDNKLEQLYEWETKEMKTVYELKYITRVVINKEKNEIYDEPNSVFLNTKEEADRLKLHIEKIAVLPRSEWVQEDKERIEGTTNWDKIISIRFVSIEKILI